MSTENQETVLAAPSQDQAAPSQGPSVSPESQSSKAEKQQLKALLSEARNTRALLTEFKSAIHNGATFPGHAMLPVARGLAFLDAILEQNKTHIKNLEERIEG